MVFKRLAAGLLKTSKKLSGRLRDLVTGRKIEAGLFDEIEEILITSDVGVSATRKFIDHLRQAWADRKIADGDQVIPYLKDYLKELLHSDGARDPLGGPAADGHPRGRRERLREDHLDREARPPLREREEEGAPRRCGHLPRRGRGTTHDLVRADRSRDREAAVRRGPGRRGV